jgi:hypothetical protein
MTKVQHLCGGSRTIDVVQGQMAGHAPIQRSKRNSSANAARSNDRQMIHAVFKLSAH